MKRLFLLMVFLAVSVQSDAAKMSSYTENTTPNEDVYFVGVDPNDTSQTVNGSNYRYSINSIMGLGLIDAVFNSLSVSGTGDSWLELNNNTTFTDSLTGKYGLRFYNGVLQQIINGAASSIGSGGSSPTIQADDPTIGSTTGWYLAQTSGDLFYVNYGIEMFTIAGARTADETDPVIGTITPSALTHDGTGASLSATVASVTETYEGYRQWSLYDVTDAAVKIDWSAFTGLSIATILIPADQHTYLVNVRCTDLAGNVGTASSSNITYSAGATNRFEWACDSLLAAVYDADDGGTITKTGTTAYVTGVTGNAIQFSPAAYAYAVATNGNNITWGDFDLEFDYRLDSTVNNSTYVVSTPYASPQQFAMYYSSTYPTSISFWVAGVNYRTSVTETLWTDTTFHHIRLVLNCAAQTLTVYVDSSQYDITLSSTTDPNPATGRLYFNGFNSTTDNQTATFDNVEIR